MRLKKLFNDLKIAGDPSFEAHLNKHNVILVDMASIYTRIHDKSLFIKELECALLDDFKAKFPSSITEKEDSLAKAITKTSLTSGERFIFLIDEWDVIYREEDHNPKLCNEYTDFLRSLFKSSDVSSCIDLVYMTGILPIRRYNTQFALNVFGEYNMLRPRGLAPLFGFTEEEVKELCSEHGMDFAQIKNWYDGYRLGGVEIYNPKSVVEAITEGECGDYWVTTSATRRSQIA